MNLSRYALQYNRVTLLLIIIIAVLGITSYQNLARDSMPPFTARVVSIVTNFPGASPKRVESLVTDPIEEITQDFADLKDVVSTSRTGLSVVTMTLNDDVPAEDLQDNWDRLRRKLSTLESRFPGGVSSPEVQDEDVGVVYGIFVGLASDGYTRRETEIYAERLRDELILLKDAARVEIGGVVPERVFVDYNDAELTKLGISATQLQRIIASANIVIPAGEVNLDNKRISIETSGNFESLDQLRKLKISIGSEVVSLREIANIYRAYETPPKEIVKVDGQPGLALYISLKDGANIVALGEDVDRVLKRFESNLPIGLSARRIASQDYDVKFRVTDFMYNVIQSVLIVLFVVLLFLGLRAGVVVATIIPATILATFGLMGYFGTGLNQVSLAALVIALGLLVDNGIVMVESLLERFGEGDSPLEAATGACREYIFPLLISSLTTSAAFLSFYLAESALGEIMGNLFTVVTMALLSSWIAAFTVIPLLAAYVLKKGQHIRSPFERLSAPYVVLLKQALRYSFFVLLITVGAFVGAIYTFGSIPFVFMPDSDRNLVTFEMSLPLGTRIGVTEKSLKEVEDFISRSLLVTDSRVQGIKSYSSYIGKGPNAFDQAYSPDEANSAYGYMIINTSSHKDNGLVISALESFAANNLPDAQVTVKRLGVGGGAAVPIQIRVSGPSPDTLFRISEKVKDKLRSIPGTKLVDDNWGPKQLKIYVKINPTKLITTGLTHEDVARSLATLLSGRNVGEYREGTEVITISMQVEGAAGIEIEDLESMSVFSQSTGRSVALIQVADVEAQWDFASIKRRDLRRTLTVESQLVEGITANEVTRVIEPWLEEEIVKWDGDYRYELGGEAERSSEAMSAVIAKLPISGLLMLLLLIIQFNSLRRTAIILLTIPLGFVGVVAGLFITQENFSFTGFLGVISLAGIVINDAIVLLDKIRIQVEAGQGEYDAIVEAANSRLSPILLTSFTTAFGLLPLYFGGSDMWRPMAVCIIFGLASATAILLVFVPVAYKVFFRVSVPTSR